MGSRVYLVDDDALVTESLGTALRLETDWQVIACNDARAALEAMTAAPPDVVVSDLKMPRLGGIGFLSAVRARFPDSVRILLTGYADKESAVRAINEVGLWQYVEKPWDTADLLLKIRQGLERRTLIDELRRTNEELAGRLRDLSAARDRLVSTERMAAVGRVVSGLAHELSNQLGLLGHAQAIAARTREPETRQSAELIVGAQRRLIAMVDEIKDFVRGEGGSYPREPADVAAVVDEAVSILRFDRDLVQRRIRVAIAARPIARLHRGKILQVIVNLVRNAAEASRSEDEIEVRVEEDAGGGARVVVIDHGAGMPPEVLARLGEPFFTTKERGSGLGLVISRRIAAEHGGRLDVASRPGEGTQAVLLLPPLSG